MTIKTKSAWTYGHTVNLEENYIPFSENGVDEIIAEMRVGAYTLEDFAIEMARAMTEAGAQEYSTSLDRTARVITVSAASNFWLYVTSSSLSNVSVYELLGFTTERSGSNSYVGDTSSGELFEPQLWLQSYVDFDNRQKANNVTVNETATGKVEVIKYGNVNTMQCNITLQTNIPQSKDSDIENRNGYDELLSFMQYSVTKAPMEFIADKEDMDTYTDCILEKTRFDSKGTGFELKELYTKGYADWWETGKIEFRKI